MAQKQDSTGDVTAAENRGFDPNALRAKYDAERDKRLRSDANEQYRELKGGLAHYMEDTYSESRIEREALHDEVEVAIIGGGFGGLLTGARLREAGVEDVRVIDAAGDFGGTWYWNRYPGIACDIEAYIYLPLLEETGYMPTQKYATGAEIFEHCKRIARKYDLYRDTCFQTRVTELRWDEDAARWIISTDRGDCMRARFVCMALGVLNHPKLPGIPGIEDFEGHSFHTSRWDYAYTGGGSDGSLTGLRGKRVGIIGTGATSVQCVPHLAETAEHLYVFQRTPSSIDVKDNHPTDPAWVASLQPGWHQKRMDNFQILTQGGYQEEDLVNDNWTEIIRMLPGPLARSLAATDRARGFREDGAGPRSCGRSCRRRSYGRGPQALLPAVLQATLHPQRLPADLQPRERHAGGHEGKGRRTHYETRGGGRWFRVRVGLPDLRFRLRGGHRLHAAGWLRGPWAKRSDPDGQVGRWCAHVARYAIAWLPELLLHHEHRPGRLRGELHAWTTSRSSPRAATRKRTW